MNGIEYIESIFLIKIRIVDVNLGSKCIYVVLKFFYEIFLVFYWYYVFFCKYMVNRYLLFEVCLFW